MKRILVKSLLCIIGWRLWAGIALAILISVELIVMVMDLLLKGEILGVDLFIGLVASALVAPCGMAVMIYLLRENSKNQQRTLEDSAKSANTRLSLAVENAKMVIWELDLIKDELHFDAAALALLGMSTTENMQHNFQSLIAHIHPDDRASFLAHFQTALQPGDRLFSLEYRVVQHDGQWGWVDCTGKVIQRDAAGNPMIAVGTTININARKLAEESLRASEQKLLTILDNADVFIYLKDTEGRYLFANRRMREFWHAEMGDIVGYSDEKFFDAATSEKIRSSDRRVLNNGETLKAEASNIVPATGKAAIYLSTKLPLRREDGSIYALCGIFTDITELKQTEVALADSNNLLRAILDSVPVRIFWKDKELRYLGCNSTFAKDAGESGPQKVIGKDDFQLGWSKQADLYRADDIRVMESGAAKLQYDEPQTTPDGKTIWLRTSKVPLRNHDRETIGILGLYQEITEQKLAEIALLESEQRLSLALEAAQMGVWEYDFSSRKLYWSPEIYRHLGLEQTESLQELLLSIVHPDDLGLFQEGMRKAIKEGVPYFAIYRLLVNGKTYWTEDRGEAQCDELGVPLKMVGVSQDITERKRVEAILRASEAHANHLANMLRMMCDNVTDMIWAKDLDNHYLFANKAMCEQLLKAIDTNEPVGKGDMFFAQRERDRRPDDPEWHTFGELCRDSDTITLQLGKHAEFDESGNVQGKFLYLDVHKSPFVNDKGEIIGVVGSARDVTAQKAAEEKLRLASAILQCSSEAMLVADADNRIVDTNPAFTKLTGYEQDEVLGKTPSVLSSGRQGAEFYREMWRVINSTGRWQGEIWNRRKNGEIYPEWLNISTVYHEDGSVYRRVALFTDITERQQVTEQLRATASELALANAQVEEERAQLAARVEQRTSQLKYANHAKDSFLATMSHEIRTPLGGLLGMMELLSMSRLDDKQSETLQVAQKSGRSLLRIVDDILDWSKIEAGKLVLASCAASISEMLRGVVNTYAQLATQKNIQIKLEIDPALAVLHIFDPLRLSQILNNFTSNALKFTERGIVQIKADRLAHHDGCDMVRFSVKDSGVGIDKEHQARLFMHYEQASADTARMYGGTGLGLSICRSLAELMEGTIEVESISGTGSTFSFTLNMPVANVAVSGLPVQHSEIEASLSPLVTDGQHVSVLIVDDHPVNRMLLKQQLDVLGLQVDAAADGTEALDLWQSEHYDLVITDCHMPVMDGYQLTDRIRDLEQQAGSKRVPIIAWTANVLAEEEERCYKAGMDDMLTKPTELAGLRVMLSKWLVRMHVLTMPSGNAVSRQSELGLISPTTTLDIGVLNKMSKRQGALVELLQEFNVQNRMDLGNLDAAMQAGNPAAVAHSAHRIKGASRMVGALELEGICKDIEDAAKQGDMQSARAAAASLADAVQRLDAAIVRFIAG